MARPKKAPPAPETVYSVDSFGQLWLLTKTSEGFRPTLGRNQNPVAYPEDQEFIKKHYRDATKEVHDFHGNYQR